MTYDVQDRLHSGHRSIVFRAVRTGDGRRVVLKQLPERFPSIKAVARLRREGEIARSVAGVDVVDVLGFEVEDGLARLVLADDGGIALGRLGSPSLEQALTWGAAIARALSRLHAAGVVHKDVTPGNVVVLPDRSVKLIDFGIASVVRRERADAIARFEGTPRYMAPEQTGRIQCGIGPAADLYSLGAVLYELICGQPPFQSDSLLELVHAHLARAPEPLHQRRTGLPDGLSELVARLLAKDPTDRYASAAGVAWDLEQYVAGRGVQRLGARDLPLRLSLPERLVGRSQERAALADAWASCCEGGVRLVAMSGVAGVGKSALLAELPALMAGARPGPGVFPTRPGRVGVLGSGKADQLNRATPFDAVRGALRQVVDELLSEPVDPGPGLAADLGEARGTLLQLLPGAQRLLGSGPAPTPQSGDARNRLHAAVQRFVHAIATPRRPVVLMLDDLQWVDLASLELLGALLRDPVASHLLIVAAWRSEEVGPTHALSRLLEELDAEDLPVSRLVVPPLSLDHTTALVAAATRREDSGALAAHCHQRTGGNPFYLGRFLADLAQDGLLRAQPGDGWVGDIATITAQPADDDVVEWLGTRMAGLPAATASALRVASRLGAEFDVTLLSEALQLPWHQVQADLEPALDDGLIVPVGEGYWIDEEQAPTVPLRFAHDRIQLAAHARDPVVDRDDRLRIGRLLRDRLAHIASGDRVFEVVEHLQSAADRLDPAERDQLTRQTLIAGERALNSAAHGLAAELLTNGVRLLPAGAWTRDHVQTLQLHIAAARALALAGRDQELATMLESVEAHAQSPLEHTRGREIAIATAVSRNRLLDAVLAALHALSELGIVLPAEPAAADVEAGIGNLMAMLAERPAEMLATAQLLDDPTESAARRIIVNVTSAAYLVRPALFPLLAVELVRRSIQRGPTAQTPYGLVVVGLVLSAIGRIDLGYPLGRLAVQLLGRWSSGHRRAAVTHIHNTHVRPFVEAIAASIPDLAQASQAGLDTGDLEYSAWAGQNLCCLELYSGLPLEQVARDCEAYGDQVLANKQFAPLACHRPWRQIVDNLRGQVDAVGELRGPHFDEDQAWAELSALDFRGALFLLATARVLIRVLTGDAKGAAAAAALGEAYEDGASATLHIPIFFFYDALAHLELARGDDPEPHIERARQSRARVAHYAAFAPANHQHRLAMIDAELASLDGDLAEALAAWDDALDHAEAHKLNQDAALAADRAGGVLMHLGRHRAARSYRERARFGYEQWGAYGLLHRFDDVVPTTPPRPNSPMDDVTTASTLAGEAIDLSALLRASQTLSQGIDLDTVLERILTTLLTAAGASRGALLLPGADDLVIALALDADGVETSAPGTPLAAATTIVSGIVRFAVRDARALVVRDVREDRRFAGDPALAAPAPTLSVLCQPLLDTGELRGVVYLENHLVAGAFTAERTYMVDLLGAQAAISIDNASLYQRTRAMADSFARFVPRASVRALQKRDLLDVSLGDVKTLDACVLFVDLRGSTAMLEQLDAEGGFALLNAWLGEVSAVIQQRGGFIDKFMGDGVMAVFPGSADDAVQAAISLHHATTALNESGRLPLGAQLAVGSGMHAGPVMLGTVGSAERLEITVIGDTVNLAARLESATKGLRCPLLISDAVVQRLGDSNAASLRPLGPVRVHGREQPVGLVEVLDAGGHVAARVASTPTFARALANLRHGDRARAYAGFDLCLRSCPDDAVALVLRDKAQTGAPVSGKSAVQLV